MLCIIYYFRNTLSFSNKIRLFLLQCHYLSPHSIPEVMVIAITLVMRKKQYWLMWVFPAGKLKDV